MSWVSSLFEVFGAVFSYVSSLPEKDRQQAIDRMKAEHLAAVAARKQFETDSAADIKDAEERLAEVVAHATAPVTFGLVAETSAPAQPLAEIKPVTE